MSTKRSFRFGKFNFTTGKIIRLVIWLCLAALSVWYTYIVRRVNSGTAFYLFWAALAGGFILIALLDLFDIFGRLPKWLRRAGIAFLCIGVLIFAGCEALILSEFSSEGEPGLDYLIVLGSQVYQDGVSSVLQFRLDKAQEYLEANPDTVCIVTGGQGYNEPYPEAYGMKRYLVEHGIDSDRIIEEDTSASTVENIRNSMDIMKEKEYDSTDPDDSDIFAETRIGVVTNNYHTFRATHIAAALGLKNVYGLSGDIDPLYLPNNMVKEALSIVKAYLSGNI